MVQSAGNHREGEPQHTIGQYTLCSVVVVALPADWTIYRPAVPPNQLMENGALSGRLEQVEALRAGSLDREAEKSHLLLDDRTGRKL